MKKKPASSTKKTDKSIQLSESTPKLIVRNATLKDVAGIFKLTMKVYSGDMSMTQDMIRGQINNFAEGQFVAVYEDIVVGYCATFRISGKIALKPHTWSEITGGGFASRHDPLGDYLYGMEVCVDQDYRGLRIGQRLYNERKKMCIYLHLNGIVFGGRIPGYLKKRKQFKTPEEYLEAVQAKEVRDLVLNFQLRNGFEILGVLRNYLSVDLESHGYAAHLIWRNPQIDHEAKTPKSSTVLKYTQKVRVACVQYQMRRVKSFEEFKSFVEYFVDVVADYKCDFVLFPEMFTLQLLSLAERQLTPLESIEAMTSYTNPFKEFMNDLAVKYNINIIGGSHPTMTEEEEVQNVSYVFLRDGSIHKQVKIHPTPNERYWWHIQGGSELSAIMTDCGPIGVLICYDSEFPELARHLVDQGANIIFVPFCTDERKSYLRVRYCAQARAVENQCYVAMAGNVGNLPGVENMDIQYAQSCILTPCDFPFARDGIAADATPNVEMVSIADLNLGDLFAARNSGTVLNLKDRRFDLYTINWRKVPTNRS
ncbi:MAG: carbon-nitrogen hydrolase family protein [Candidatus Hinthialibacter antarcticus]|nr:carbon-nitrogen hydrolase family protein [Candidatus Hinthialibacter antarcticus]